MTVSLQGLALVDSPPEQAFDNLTQLAAQFFSVPVSLVSIVETEKNRQYFKSQIGLAEPWASNRQTPLSHSFCQHVVKTNDALVVEHAPTHELVSENLAIRDLGVIAYLGAPIHAPTGQPLGALCVIDSAPREWTDYDVSALKSLANCVTDTIALRATAQDTQRLRQEQQLFTYAFSHDLKAPAASVALVLEELLKDPGLAEENRELIVDGIKLTTHISQQVEDVLDYTHSFTETMEIEDVDLNQIARKVLLELSACINERGAQLEFDMLPRVQGCAKQLQSLLQNLLSNAIKFTHAETAPLIQVRATEYEKFYKISVIDNGIGFDLKYKNKIFDLFTRLHTRSEYPGTGIGLTLCQRVIANHNGKIDVTSAPGAGATFCVTLPIDLS